ncbi:MAG: 6-carboxytetrahydropterin synthase QueD [Candidatus Margulisiibacteriota bacterium]
MFELMVEENFAAAHALRGYQGPCENLHGHTWKVQVFLRGERLNELGVLEDFEKVKKDLKEILKEFDHKLLNDLPPFEIENPSSENLAKVIYHKIKSKQKLTSKVIIWESPTTYASFS